MNDPSSDAQGRRPMHTGTRRVSVKHLTLVVATVVLIGWLAVPAVNGTARQQPDRGNDTSRAKREAVAAVLSDLGVGSDRSDAVQNDRLVAGLERLVEAGIIEEAKIDQLTAVARSGDLGRLMSERAGQVAAERSNGRAGGQGSNRGDDNGNGPDPTTRRPPDRGSGTTEDQRGTGSP